MTTTTTTKTTKTTDAHKTTRYLKLKGFKANGHLAKRYQGAEVTRFTSDTGCTYVSKLADGTVQLTTTKGEYALTHHKTLKDLWVGECNGVEVHFSRKKVVAKLTYWA